MALTEKQLEALLKMGDIGGQEDELARQSALSEQLRDKVTGVTGGGLGANIGRAAYGTASAVSDYRNKDRVKQISQDKQSLLADLLRRRQMGGGSDITAPTGMNSAGYMPQE